MKKFTISTLLALALSCGWAQADVAVYSGKAVVKTTSSDASGAATFGTIHLIDLETGASVAITTAKKGPLKFYKASSVIASKLTTIEDKKGKLSTVVTFVSNDDDATVSFLVKGANSKAKIKTGSEVEIPKNIAGTAFTLLSPELTSGALIEFKLNGKLDTALSLELNDAALDLEAAAAEVISQLEEAGYEENDDLP